MKVAGIGLVCLAGAFVGLSGCASVTSGTELRADGAFDREIVLKSSMPELGAPSNPGPRLEDWYTFPTDKAWKVVRAKVKGEETATLTRSFPAATPAFTDILIKEKGKPVLRNAVTVVKRADGLLEYTETFHWTGDAGEAPKPEQLVAQLRPLLAPEIADDAALLKLAERVTRQVWKEIFGPGEPLLGQFITHPQAAERILRRRSAAALNLALEEVLGNKISDPQRQNFVRRVFAKDGIKGGDIFDPQKKAESEASGGSSAGSSPGLVAMLSSVKFSGTVVSTNGELDLATGEVFWALYPQAAVLGDVTLRVVVRPPAP